MAGPILKRRTAVLACGCEILPSPLPEASAMKEWCPVHSAAPELLAELKFLVTACVTCYGTGCVQILRGLDGTETEPCSQCSGARAAISKAGGAS